MHYPLRRRDPESTADDVPGGDRLRRFVDPQTVVWGLIGGLVATVVMTVYRLPIARALPPTAEFWAQYVGGGEPEDYPAIALLLHLVYGAGGGVAFGVLADHADVPGTSSPEASDALLGLGYGLGLSWFGERVILGRLLGRDLDPDEAFVFHASHVIYGLTLGSWVGSRGEE